MKAIAIAITYASILLSIMAQVHFAENMHAADYERIISYVLKVENEGFSQKEFDEFAYERKVMRKNVYIVPGLMQSVLLCSTLFATI